MTPPDTDTQAEPKEQSQMSSAEQGSSIRITSGSTATVRAMHNRCC